MTPAAWQRRAVAAGPPVGAAGPKRSARGGVADLPGRTRPAVRSGRLPEALAPSEAPRQAALRAPRPERAARDAAVRASVLSPAQGRQPRQPRPPAAAPCPRSFRAPPLPPRRDPRTPALGATHGDRDRARGLSPPPTRDARSGAPLLTP